MKINGSRSLRSPESLTPCKRVPLRFNQNGVDLNRNFPDAFTHQRQKPPLDERKLEAEVSQLIPGPVTGGRGSRGAFKILSYKCRCVQVQAVIGWLRNETFVLSANLHGGALVASYPYDNSNGGQNATEAASRIRSSEITKNRKS